MENIKNDTIRLENPGCYQRRPVPCNDIAPLPSPSDSSLLFSEVLKRRRSANLFFPLSEQKLSNFLYDVASFQYVNLADSNRQKRYVPSMGALHPAHLILYRPGKGWVTYLSDCHALGVLKINEAAADSIRRIAAEHYQSDSATLLYLLSDCDLAGNYYQHYIPLLLKDAGVLLGHASLVAAAHGLAFRILGRNGFQIMEALVSDLPFKSLPSGLALLGAETQTGD